EQQPGRAGTDDGNLRAHAGSPPRLAMLAGCILPDRQTSQQWTIRAIDCTIRTWQSEQVVTNTIPSYRLYREKSGESGDFWIHSETIPERTHLHNWEISRHRHDSFFQLFLLTAGSGEIVGTEDVRRFEAPCALFIPPGAVH